MKFQSVFAVLDIHKARAFYEDVLHLKVQHDFGRNLVFTCGLVLQEDFDWLIGICQTEMKRKELNCELYFEMENFDAFIEVLKKRTDIRYLHEVKMHSWGQRVVRIFDLDEHLIEIGESMSDVVRRFLKDGKTMEEIAHRMDVSQTDVENMIV